jgi:hypothetical protein
MTGRPGNKELRHQLSCTEIAGSVSGAGQRQAMR